MIFRSIKTSAGRFAAIFAISALGVGFLAGLSAATPDMVLSGSRYFAENRLADVRVLSNVGLDRADAETLEKVEGVKSVMAVKNLDALFVTPEKETIGVTVIGLEEGVMLDRPVNRLTLISGRLPENDGECLVENTIEAVAGLEIGEIIEYSPQNDGDTDDIFIPRKLTVVGVVENPYYMSMQREQTSIGNGKISQVVYVPDSAFDMDYYTAIYLTVEGTDGEISMSRDYWDILSPVTDRIEELAETQKYSRHGRVLAEAREKIEDAWQTYNEKRAEADEEFAKAEDKIAKAERDIADGKKTLNEKETEARQEIADGERELADAYEELVQGEKDLAEGKQDYEDGKKEYEDGLIKYQDGLKEYEEGKAEYEDGLAEYEKGKKKYEDGEKSLSSARRRLREAESQYDAGYAQYKAGMEQLQAGQQQLDETAAGLASMLGLSGVTSAQMLIDIASSDPVTEAAIGAYLEPIKQGQAEIDAQRAVLDAAGKELDDASAQISRGWDKVYDGENELKKAKRQLLNAWLTLEDGRRELEEAETELNDARQELEDAKIELDDAEKDIAQAEIDLKDGWQEYNDGVKELEEGKAELEEEVAKARADIAQGERDLAEGKQDYEEARAEAEQKLADAEYEIKDAEKKLDDISEPKWYVLDRDSILVTAGFDSNTQKVASIAKVFPVFFFMIAALVCLTTMTRMVEEERGLIGTMKALGYSSGIISSKYLIYAFLASVTGSLLGLAVGFRVFPEVIWHAYGIMYRLPELYTPFNWGYAAFSSISTVACIMAATWWVCRESLAESAASLMLPKAPQPGKRVFLERIGPIWSRLTFNSKVTVRNLFRYKKRFFMTVIGVSGCAALLVAGFGLRDSISDILSNQFETLWGFDLMVGIRPLDEEPIDERLSAIVNGLEGYMAVGQESGKVSLKGGPTSEVTIYVPENPDEFAKNYVLFRTRVGHKPVEFGSGKAVLTEKASRTIGAQVGDEITLEDADGEQVTVTLVGITENYIQGFIYVAPDLYSEIFDREAKMNMLFCRAGRPDGEAREALAEEILKCSSALSCTFTQDTADNFGDTFKSIDMIVIVLIVSAGLLAFVVLYNLTNININERHKEIATLKVLGFYEGEVASYILKETNILSALGGLLGMGLGKVLHAFVVRTAEVDMVMFGRIIVTKSYVNAFAMTMAFSLAVSLFMLRRLKKVSMVESLKAPE